ncbi:helix-turn-helix domain-containing protein [Melittangium boletus]
MSPSGKSHRPKPPIEPTPENLAPLVKRELKRLGSRLREARQASGLTQEQAAEMMGLHPKYMPRLEGGTANPTVATLVAASVAYKVPLRDLFSEDDKGT